MLAPFAMLFLVLLAACWFLGVDQAVGFAFSEEGIRVVLGTLPLIAVALFRFDRFVDTRWRNLNPLD